MRFVLPAVAGPVRMVPLEALADKEISVAALRQAAERGRLRAQRIGRGRGRAAANGSMRTKLAVTTVFARHARRGDT
jgi:hypothetical protein